MHIGFIVSNFPTDGFKNAGGIETSVKNLASKFIEKGIKVSVFVYGQKNDTYLFQNEISIYFIKNVKFKGISWLLTRKKIQKKIHQVHKQHKIDFIEAPDWGGITAFMNLKPKIIIRLHGSDSYFCKLENRKVKKFNFFIEKKALKNADYILSVSNFTAIETKKIFAINTVIKVIHNGIDITLFENKRKLHKSNTILYFGTLLRKKGVLELATIFNLTVEKKSDTKLILLGNDIVDVETGKSTLVLFKERLSTAAIKNFVHKEAVPYHKVKDEIANASIVVFPSFAEAFPMSWLEAMAMKKAVVSSNIGWSKEIMINNHTGFTVSPKNHQLFSDKIVQLLNNKEQKDIFGENARKRIEENFSSERIADKNIEYYNSLL